MASLPAAPWPSKGVPAPSQAGRLAGGANSLPDERLWQVPPDDQRSFKIVEFYLYLAAAFGWNLCVRAGGSAMSNSINRRHCHATEERVSRTS